MHWSLDPITDLPSLAESWDSLNSSCGGLPFLESRFLLPLCRFFGHPDLKVATCRAESTPVAMAILRKVGWGKWETFQPSQLPLGAWVARAEIDWSATLTSLVRDLPGLALSVGITQMDPAIVPRPNGDSRTRIEDYIATARVEVSGTFDEYWARRGKNLRQNMRKQRNRLKESGIIPRLEILTDPHQMTEAISVYGGLEMAGWKSTRGTAVHPDNNQGRFYATVLADFAQTGDARVYLYWFGERIVAVDLCLTGGGAIVILKTTYDESENSVSPAFLMREESFRELFKYGTIRRIEFYGRVMEWHTRWTDDVRTLFHITRFSSAAITSIRDFFRRRNFAN